MIIDNFNTIEQEEEQENTIYCEDKFILSTNFDWSIYNNDFKLIYSEFEKLFFDLMDKYQTNEEKFKKHLKKFALKYPTNKFCNLLLDNIDKSSFYDLNIIIAEKFTQESNI